MSHIEGHVDEPPKSCGKLHLIANGVTQLDFVPPPFALTKGTRIGFHPIFKDGSHKSVLAVDIVLWDDHVAAEEILKGRLPGLFDNIEEIYDDSSKKAQVDAQLTNGNLEDKHYDVIRKSLDYFKQNDFKKFYKRGSGKASSANAELMIIQTVGGPLPIALTIGGVKAKRKSIAKKKIKRGK